MITWGEFKGLVASYHIHDGDIIEFIDINGSSKLEDVFVSLDRNSCSFYVEDE